MKALKIKTILVPTDLSKMSLQALGAAKELGQRLRADIHLLHVNTFYPAGFIPSAGPTRPAGWPAHLPAEFKAAQWRDLNDLAARFGVPPANCYLREGLPVFDNICRFARSLKADLIIMPTHGRTGLKHAYLGSTAERVVQHAPCPVLVTRGKLARIDRILVPVDFSNCSLGALNQAIAFAAPAGAKIIVAHAVHLDLAFTADGYAMYDLTTVVEEAKRTAAEEMQSFVRRAKFGPIPFQTRVEVGPPAIEISRLAEETKAQLIITSTHGRTGLKHLLIGSVAEQIVRYASVPVLVIPSHPAGRWQRLGRVMRERGSKVSPSAPERVARTAETFTRRSRRTGEHAFPERRKTNKFRESHRAS